MKCRNRSAILIVIVLVATLGMAGCASDASHKRTGIGSGLGAGLGAGIGAIFGSGKGAAIGAAAGALTGAGVGHYMDRQHDELKRKLAAQEASHELSVTRLNQDTLEIGIASDASFGVDSSTLDPKAQNTFTSIANVLKDYDKTAIHVVGFTDSTGSAQHNLKLSHERAQSVAQFLQGRGVNSQRVLTWARGESQPVASNDTAEGRAKNRRVAIVIKPIVKDSEKAAFTAPPNLGNPAYEDNSAGR